MCKPVVFSPMKRTTAATIKPSNNCFLQFLKILEVTKQGFLKLFLHINYQFLSLLCLCYRNLWEILRCIAKCWCYNFCKNIQKWMERNISKYIVLLHYKKHYYSWTFYICNYYKKTDSIIFFNIYFFLYMFIIDLALLILCVWLLLH